MNRQSLTIYYVPSSAVTTYKTKKCRRYKMHCATTLFRTSFLLFYRKKLSAKGKTAQH